MARETSSDRELDRAVVSSTASIGLGDAECGEFPESKSVPRTGLVSRISEDPRVVSEVNKAGCSRKIRGWKVAEEVHHLNSEFGCGPVQTVDLPRQL